MTTLAGIMILAYILLYRFATNEATTDGRWEPDTHPQKFD